MDNPLYTVNDAERCYHCKYTLFDLSAEVAADAGLHHVAYGYTASDRKDVRPGHRAALEKNIRFPLAESGLDKKTIRSLLKHFRIFIHDKPSSPCLASRLAQGIPVTAQRLKDVADMENILRGGGVTLYRVRLNAADKGLFIRIECGPGEMERVVPLAPALERMGKKRGYRWVTLDLGGYRLGGADR